MIRLHYVVRIDKDVKSDWGASVPDLPGCVATAKTLDAAVRRIRAAIELHLSGMKDDGVPVPRPRVQSIRPTRTRNRTVVYASVEVVA